MNFKKEVEKAIGLVAAEYAYAKELLSALQQIEQQPSSQQEKDVNKALRLLRWIGRGERRIDRSEHAIVTELQKNHAELLSLEDNSLIQQLKVVEAKLVKAASFYLGDLKTELQEIKTYAYLREKYESNPLQLLAITPKLSTLIQAAEQNVSELVRWVQATERVLQQLQQRVSNPAMMTRRSFLRKAGTLAAGVAATMYGGKVFGASGDSFSTEQKVSSISAACGFIEEFCERQAQNISSSIQFTPHGDYTQFNRVGVWKHEMIAGGEAAELGAKFLHVLKEQRLKAAEAFQPTDREVTIFERTLVALANMRGRSKIAALRRQVLVPKHFPGGPPELEFTEIQKVVFDSPYEKFDYLLPFIHFLGLPATRAIMISTACYPRIEKKFVDKYYSQYEAPIIAELSFAGWNAAKHAAWIKERPAIASPIILRGLLRDVLAFKGIIFSDALYMRGYEDVFFELDIDMNKFTELITPSPTLNAYQLRQFILCKIMAIYAGIDGILVLVNHKEEKEANRIITAFAERSPYFSECLKASLRRIKENNEYRGWKTPPLSSLAEQVEYVMQGRACYGWTDPWDRGGVLHQLFRRKYLSVLYNNPKMMEDQKVFWEIHQKTTWKELDSLYQEVIKIRYKA